jgi:hypothetical protein
MIGPLGIDTTARALVLRRFELQRCGEDILLSGYL